MQTVVTPSVLAAQKHYFGNSQRIAGASERDALTDDEAQFIQSRDSFYMATVTETGWPYMQHRGGAPGFLHVVSPTQLSFADYKGNRQLLSTGNITANDRVCLFLMDYPQRTRCSAGSMESNLTCSKPSAVSKSGFAISDPLFTSIRMKSSDRMRSNVAAS